MISEDRTGDVLTITIDNASQANALTEEMLDQLIGAFIEAGADESLRAVLLTSTGGRGLAAGMDTTQFAHSSASRAYETISCLGEVCEAIKNCALPAAVAIDGCCIGAVEIAAAADFRIGGSGSWYAMPEVRIGIPSVLESVNLPRLRSKSTRSPCCTPLCSPIVRSSRSRSGCCGPGRTPSSVRRSRTARRSSRSPSPGRATDRRTGD